jgi:hypothetical protein
MLRFILISVLGFMRKNHAQGLGGHAGLPQM